MGGTPRPHTVPVPPPHTPQTPVFPSNPPPRPHKAPLSPDGAWKGEKGWGRGGRATRPPSPGGGRPAGRAAAASSRHGGGERTAGLPLKVTRHPPGVMTSAPRRRRGAGPPKSHAPCPPSAPPQPPQPPLSPLRHHPSASSLLLASKGSPPPRNLPAGGSLGFLW